MDHLPAVGCGVTGTGEKDVSARHAAHEALVRADAIPALHTLGVTRRFEPVVGTCRRDHPLVGSQPAQRHLGPLIVPQIPVDVGGYRVAVHGIGQSRRSAVPGDLAHDTAHRLEAGAAAAQLAGNAGGEQTVFTQVTVILRDELAAVVVAGRSAAECLTELLRHRDPVRRDGVQN